MLHFPREAAAEDQPNILKHVALSQRNAAQVKDHLWASVAVRKGACTSLREKVLALRRSLMLSPRFLGDPWTSILRLCVDRALQVVGSCVSNQAYLQKTHCAGVKLTAAELSSLEVEGGLRDAARFPAVTVARSASCAPCGSLFVGEQFLS